MVYREFFIVARTLVWGLRELYLQQKDFFKVIRFNSLIFFFSIKLLIILFLGLHLQLVFGSYLNDRFLAKMKLQF